MFGRRGKREDAAAVPTAGPCLVVSDDTDTIAVLEAELAAAGHGNHASHDITGFLSLPKGADASVILLDLPDLADTHEQLLRRLAHAGPAPRVIVISSGSNALAARFAVRAGAADLLERPLAPGAVADALDRAALAPAGPGCRITIVHGVAGGVGATVLALMMAGELAGRATTVPGKVALVDLDVQTGAAGLYLDAPGGHALAELLDAAERFDAEYLASVLLVTQGLRLFSFGDAAHADDPRVPYLFVRVMELLEPGHAHIVVDLPAHARPWTMPILAAADDIVLVTRPTVPSLRLARARYDDLLAGGREPRQMQLIVNRVRSGWQGGTLDRKDIARALGSDAFATVRDQPAGFEEAANLGVLPQSVGSGKAITDLRRILQELRL